MKRKKLIIFSLLASLPLAPVVSVSADDTDTTTADISEISANIDDLQAKKDALLNQIDDLEAQLVTAIASVNHIDSQLTDLQNQMKQTESDLAAALKEREVQHEAMKARIQYVYERGGNEGWISVFLNDGDINAWLNQNMTEDMYKYDRQQLEDYAAAVTKVQTLQAQQQEQKSQLEKKKNSLVEGKEHLESLLKEAKDKYSSSEFDQKIADAYAKADAYATIVAEQNGAISQMVQLQSANAGGDTSADTAAADNGYTYTAAAYVGDTGSGAGEASTGAQQSTGAADTTTEEAQSTINQVAQQLAEQTGTDVETAKAAATQAYAAGTVGNGSTASGEALLQYAQQFLGNPYVYGGNSLTDGIDCSGFVQQVYANFGISTARTSYDMANEGEEVSYNDAQVGDVFVYDGHVGIYAGNGQMINAADENSGITYTPVDYDQIQTIRRFLPDDSSSSSSDTDTSSSYDDSSSYEQ